jgi:hypothetical protein
MLTVAAGLLDCTWNGVIQRAARAEGGVVG